MTVVLVAVAIVAVLGGTLALGIWIGRGLADDQADDDAGRQLPALEVTPAAVTAPLRPRMPTGRPNYHPGDYVGPGRIPGYTDPFPRAGRFDIPAPPAAGHAAPTRPLTSPGDLDADVARMCDDNAIYVAALIARSRHAERIGAW